MKLSIIACFTELLLATVIVETGEGRAPEFKTKMARALSVSGAQKSRAYSVRASQLAGMVAPPRLTRQRSCFDMFEVGHAHVRLP